MPKVIVVTRGGNEVELQGGVGNSLMETIRDGLADELQAICGGYCSCATCHVYVDPAFASRLSAMNADEDSLLDGSSYREGSSRLSCQIRLTDELEGLRVTVAPEN